MLKQISSSSTTHSLAISKNTSSLEKLSDIIMDINQLQKENNTGCCRVNDSFTKLFNTIIENIEYIQTTIA
jgi:hypothetical protein